MILNQLYSDKPASYFGNARRDIVDALVTDGASSILELGCGAGGTGAAALAAGKAGTYVGIELNPAAAEQARQRITQVIEGDVEAVDVAALRNRFDALIISEVLEHLTDPWGVVRKLAGCLRPGAQVFASSPNVAHWRVVRSLLLGSFNYQEAGVMDRTHLRWFTPDTYRDMFEQAGINVAAVKPLSANAPRTRIINKLTRNRFNHLFMEQIMLTGTKV
jgi:2-polyprenyl-3-methyl-5-hydroxy-6-metoxy-1,4-benzoquinol methylase